MHNSSTDPSDVELAIYLPTPQKKIKLWKFVWKFEGLPFCYSGSGEDGHEPA